MALPELYLDNDFEPQFKITVRDEHTGRAVVAAGINNLSIFVSAVEASPMPIHSTLNKSAVERDQAAGYYWCTLAGTDMRAHMADKVNAPVWLVLSDGSGHILISTKYIVRAVRRL